MLLAAPSPGATQAVFLCEGEGHAFAVAGSGTAPPGCREIATVRELGLATAQSDLDALARATALLSDRVTRLETLLARPAPKSDPLAPTTRRYDPTDTQSRTRDLGQDIRRRLDGLGR